MKKPYISGEWKVLFTPEKHGNYVNDHCIVRGADQKWHLYGITSFDGMGGMQRIITGSGVFLGENAFAQFRMLAKLFEDEDPGNLEHPIWGIRYCYFTGLELTQEPKENCVSYKFEFTSALTNGIVPR